MGCGQYGEGMMVTIEQNQCCAANVPTVTNRISRRAGGVPTAQPPRAPEMTWPLHHSSRYARGVIDPCRQHRTPEPVFLWRLRWFRGCGPDVHVHQSWRVIMLCLLAGYHIFRIIGSPSGCYWRFRILKDGQTRIIDWSVISPCLTSGMRGWILTFMLSRILRIRDIFPRKIDPQFSQAL